MNKVFNLENNVILNTLRNKDVPYKFSIIDDYDSYHCIVNIKISDYYDGNNREMMEFLYKNKFSINALIKTSDSKFLSIRRYETHSYRHIKNNSVLICSYRDMLRKIRILEKSLYKEEIEELNIRIKSNRILERFIPRVIKLSLIDIMSLLDINLCNNSNNNNSRDNNLSSSHQSYVLPYRQLSHNINNHNINNHNINNHNINNHNINNHNINTNFLCFPGGHVDKRKDKTPIDTLNREILEEINLVDKLHIISIRYHNIFDKLNEKFYHNLIYLCSIESTSEDLHNNFKSTYEVKDLQFHSSSNKIIASIISTE